MVSFGVYSVVTLADARQRREEARKQTSDGINPSEARKEHKRALIVGVKNTFDALVREWYGLKSAKWSAGYASDIMEAFTVCW